MALAQMVLIETEVHYAASQTAKVCAQKAVVQQPQNARGVFFSIYEGGYLCENLIDGGKRGISIHSTLLEGEQLQIKAAKKNNGKKKDIFRICKALGRI